MRIAQIIGTVTLSRWHPSLATASYRLAVPLTLAALANTDGQALPSPPPGTEELVVYDDLGAGFGSRIAMSEGGEAAQPFANDKPVDAYNAAILDAIRIRLPEISQ